MKQAESKPLKVLIRVKKDQVGNLLCYIVGIVTMPQRRLENKFDRRRTHQSPFENGFDLLGMQEGIRRSIRRKLHRHPRCLHE